MKRCPAVENHHAAAAAAMSSLYEDMKLGPFPDIGCLCKRASPRPGPDRIFLTESPVDVQQQIMCEYGQRSQGSLLGPEGRR